MNSKLSNAAFKFYSKGGNRLEVEYVRGGTKARWSCKYNTSYMGFIEVDIKSPVTQTAAKKHAYKIMKDFKK